MTRRNKTKWILTLPWLYITRENRSEIDCTKWTFRKPLFFTVQTRTSTMLTLQLQSKWSILNEKHRMNLIILWIRFFIKIFEFENAKTNRCFSFKNNDFDHATTKRIQFWRFHPYKCVAKIDVQMFAKFTPIANHCFLDFKCENQQYWCLRCGDNHPFWLKNIEWISSLFEYVFSIKIIQFQNAKTNRRFSFKNDDYDHATTNRIKFWRFHPYKCLAKIDVQMFAKFSLFTNHYFLHSK